MSNNVFANELELACKSGAGVTAVAFPDPCWSPPPPKPGPIVIPYPNTAKASDTANGSKTVMITGKPVTLKNKSYFKTSTGNEPATYAFRKGTKTGKIKGKCYFTSWSMNVKIEGYNVCRHSDDTTHNHASHPGNTGNWGFIDQRNVPRACAKDVEREGKACKGLVPKNPDENGRPRQRSWIRRLFSGDDYRSGGRRVNWKASNCAGLNASPTDLGNKNLEEIQDEISQSIDQLGDVTDGVTEMIDQVVDELKGVIEEKVIAAAVKKAAGAAAAGTGVGAIVTLILIADAIKDAAELAELAKELTNMSNEAQRIVDTMSDMQSKLESVPEQLRNGNTQAANDTLADLQRTIATANPCLRAKKCQLVSKNSADNGNSPNAGCCKGQTGHHLIPNSYLRGACPGVTNGNAPTVCAEGTTHSAANGSHGALHTHLDNSLLDSNAVNADQSLSYEDARESAIESHKKAFPFSECSRRCLRAQLDKHYKDKCNKDLTYRPMPGGVDAGTIQRESGI